MFKYDPSKTLMQNFDAFEEWKKQGNWYPANKGTETPFKTKGGVTLLYCFQPRSGRHAYLNVDNDLVLSDDEALTLLESR